MTHHSMSYLASVSACASGVKITFTEGTTHMDLNPKLDVLVYETPNLSELTLPQEGGQLIANPKFCEIEPSQIPRPYYLKEISWPIEFNLKSNELSLFNPENNDIPDVIIAFLEANNAQNFSKFCTESLKQFFLQFGNPKNLTVELGDLQIIKNSTKTAYNEVRLPYGEILALEEGPEGWLKPIAPYSYQTIFRALKAVLGESLGSLKNFTDDIPDPHNREQYDVGSAIQLAAKKLFMDPVTSASDIANIVRWTMLYHAKHGFHSDRYFPLRGETSSHPSLK